MEKEKKFRACNECDELTIPKNKAPKYKYCNECFMYIFVKNFDCPDCKKNRISEKQLFKYRRCYECNINRKKMVESASESSDEED